MKLKMVWIFYERRMLPVPSSKTKGKQTCWLGKQMSLTWMVM